MPELPDAKKWLTGFFDVTRYIKDFGTILRMVLIVAVAYLLVVGAVAVWKRAMPKPKTPTVSSVDVKGSCEISGDVDKRVKWGLVNLW